MPRISAVRLPGQRLLGVDMEKTGIVLLAIAIGAGAGLGIYYWVKTLNEISRSSMPPEERRRWWRRVFLLRVVGVMWYESHKRKSLEDQGPKAN